MFAAHNGRMHALSTDAFSLYLLTLNETISVSNLIDIKTVINETLAPPSGDVFSVCQGYRIDRYSRLAKEAS